MAPFAAELHADDILAARRLDRHQRNDLEGIVGQAEGLDPVVPGADGRYAEGEFRRIHAGVGAALEYAAQDFVDAAVAAHREQVPPALGHGFARQFPGVSLVRRADDFVADAVRVDLLLRFFPEADGLARPRVGVGDNVPVAAHAIGKMLMPLPKVAL